MFVRTFFINEQIIYGAYVIATCMSRCHMTISNNLRIVFDKKNTTHSQFLVGLRFIHLLLSFLLHGNIFMVCLVVELPHDSCGDAS